MPLTLLPVVGSICNPVFMTNSNSNLRVTACLRYAKTCCFCKIDTQFGIGNRITATAWRGDGILQGSNACSK